MNSTAELVELLAARRGIVCAAGAGGKKSVLRAIAAAHPGRVAMTGTVPFAPPPETLEGHRYTGSLEALEQQLAATAGLETGVFMYGMPEEKKGRWGGVPAGSIVDWHRRFGFEATLVKADGARMRWIKAPADTEPVLTPRCDTLIPVLSARALGEPLAERIAHRLPQVEQVSGCRPGEIFQPVHAARLLASPNALLKSAGDARVRPVINMVDDETRTALAAEAARLALAMTERFDQILLMRLKTTPELVAVIDRAGSGQWTK